jgi:5-methylcytosine-specific restriction endonuclease McrA
MSGGKKAIRKAFRDGCFARDKYTCVMCGKKSTPEKVLEDMDCHHITDRSLLPNGGYVKENGITLRDEDHKKAEVFHSTGAAYPGYAPEDLYKAINSTLEKATIAAEKLS